MSSRRSNSSSGRSSARSYSSSRTYPQRRFSTSQTAAATPVEKQQRPSLFQEMAATAGGVAVGSAIGHTVGQAITGGLSGGKEAPQQQQQQQQQQANEPTEPTGPCAWEIKQFLQCAQSQTDITVCQGFNDAIKQCKITHGLK